MITGVTGVAHPVGGFASKKEAVEFEALLDLYMTALGMPLGPTDAEQDEALGADEPSESEAHLDSMWPGAARRAKRAAKEFVDSVEKMGGATITVGDKVVEIGKGRKKSPKSDAIGFDLGDGV